MSLYMTPAVVLAFPNLFEAKIRKNPNPKDRPMFSAAFLLDDEAWTSGDAEAIRAAVEQAAVDKWGADTFKRMVAEGTFENPFKRDVTSKGYPAHIVRYFNAASGADYPPGVFHREADPANPKRPKPVTDRREIYPGVIVRASVTIRAYGGPGTQFKPGVKIDLRNVQKLRDGERLAGSGSDGSEFDTAPPAEPVDPNGGPLGGMLD